MNTIKKAFPQVSVACKLLLVILLVVSFVFGYASRANAQEPLCVQPFQPVSKPLTELGNTPYVRMGGQKTEFTGGLYPDGSNQRPAEHEAAGLAIAAQITPLNRDGQPDPVDGKIVMVAIGMSNTNTEFNRFMGMAHKDREINPKLVLINGALGGRTAERWIDPNGDTWQEVNRLIAEKDLTPLQVQVAWVKQTLTGGGEFPAKALELQSGLEEIARNLKRNYPNIKIAYYSSRTRSYTYGRGLSPEPVAFETGFSVKWMIEKQINQDPTLNYDPARGQVAAPFLSWGPYLWIDGTNPRSDGRIWTAAEMTSDCTHPSPSGAIMIGEMLLEFFKTDTLAEPWFLASLATPTVAAIDLSNAPTATLVSPPTTADLNRSTAEVPTPGPTEIRPQNTSQLSVIATSTPRLPISQKRTPNATIMITILAMLSVVVAVGWFWLRPRVFIEKR